MSDSSSNSVAILVFTLVQKAKNKGGDKYVCESNENFIIYFPQEISRANQKDPKKTLTITIS